MNPSSKKETLLIIEGKKALGDSLAKGLQAEGYTVVIKNTGTDGLKAIYDTLPRLVILDLNIIDMDPYEFLAKKHSDMMLGKVPVFLLSSEGVSINMRKVPENSVADFVVSLDLDPSDLVARVDRFFGHSPSSENQDLKDDGKAKNAKKILWIEDDKLISSILMKKFVAAGMSVIHAINGEEALTQLKDVFPDLIILDITLPGMDGFEILQKIHMDERLKKVPTLILSNLSRPSDFEKAKILGATKYMVKASSSLDQIVSEAQVLMA